MKINLKTIAAILILSTGLLDSCQKNMTSPANDSQALNGPQQVKIFLTDHPTPVFDSVFIDIQQMEVKLEDDSIANGGWVTLNIHPGVYNILRFRNGIDTLFANGTLHNGRLRKLRLTLGDHNSVIKNGQSFPLQLHNSDRQVIAEMNESNFDIVGPGQIMFWIDFDAGTVLGNSTLERAATELFDQVVAVASGQTVCKNEINGYRDIAIFKDGVIL